jgi:hypothetical protein
MAHVVAMTVRHCNPAHGREEPHVEHPYPDQAKEMVSWPDHLTTYGVSPHLSMR